MSGEGVLPDLCRAKVETKENHVKGEIEKNFGK